MANTNNGDADSAARNRRNKNKASKTVPNPPEWKEHLDSYKALKRLCFESEKDLDAAIGLLWTDDLRFLPHDTPDGVSLIVPDEAVPYFTRAGIKFTAKKMRSAGDLTPEELAKLRR